MLEIRSPLMFLFFLLPNEISDIRYQVQLVYGKLNEFNCITCQRRDVCELIYQIFIFGISMRLLYYVELTRLSN